MLEYAWGIRQEKRSSSFQVILTKFLMLHVDLILILKLILKARKRKRYFRTETNYTNHTTTSATSPTMLFKISFFFFIGNVGKCFLFLKCVIIKMNNLQSVSFLCSFKVCIYNDQIHSKSIKKWRPKTKAQIKPNFNQNWECLRYHF